MGAQIVSVSKAYKRELATVLTVFCSKCGARPGQRCYRAYTGPGQMYRTHAFRKERYEQTQQQRRVRAARFDEENT